MHRQSHHFNWVWFNLSGGRQQREKEETNRKSNPSRLLHLAHWGDAFISASQTQTDPRSRWVGRNLKLFLKDCPRTALLHLHHMAVHVVVSNNKDLPYPHSLPHKEELPFASFFSLPRHLCVFCLLLLCVQQTVGLLRFNQTYLIKFLFSYNYNHLLSHFWCLYSQLASNTKEEVGQSATPLPSEQRAVKEATKQRDGDHNSPLNSFFESRSLTKNTRARGAKESPAPRIKLSPTQFTVHLLPMMRIQC